MYSTSLNQRIGTLVEKDSLSLSKDTIVSDAVIAMKEKGMSSVLVTTSDSTPYHAERTVSEHTSTSESALLSNSIIGIATERDVLYRVIADKRDPMKVTLGEIMSSPIIAVDENLLLKDAILLMRRRHIRRLLVTSSLQAEKSSNEISDEGKTESKKLSQVVPLGTVTLMSIAGNMPSEHLELAEVEIPSSPYNLPSHLEDKRNVGEVHLAIVCPYCESKFENKKDLSKHIDRIHLGSGLLEGDVRQW